MQGWRMVLSLILNKDLIKLKNVYFCKNWNCNRTTERGIDGIISGLLRIGSCNNINSVYSYVKSMVDG